MAQIAAPFGIRGWVWVNPLGDAPEGLAAHAHWWIKQAGRWSQRHVNDVNVRGARLTAKLQDCDDRNAAELLRHAEVAIARSEFPELAEQEMYWTDLEGCEVVNEAGKALGTVVRLFSTGANDVMVIRAQRDGKPFERLIPWVDAYVRRLDKSVRRIVVEWDESYD